MEKFEVIINFRDGVISIGDSDLEMNRIDNEDALERKMKQKFINSIRSIDNTKTYIQNINKSKISGCERISHRIITRESDMICKKQYPAPFNIRNLVQDELKRLLDLNVIQRSKDRWSSPAFAMQKKNGEIRLLVDYRELNKVTVPMNHPNPGIEDLLQGLDGSKYFSTIDLLQGYYQIPMDPRDVHKTGFVILNGHYEYLKMPMGLSMHQRPFEE